MSPHDRWYRFEKIPPYGLYRISWQVLIVAPLPKNQINKKPKKISHVISCLSTVTFHLATTRVSKSHGRVTAQNSSDFAQNLEICMRKQKIYAFQPRLQFFFYSCFTYIMWLSVNLCPLCLAQSFNTKVLTAQKKSTFRMSGHHSLQLQQQWKSPEVWWPCVCNFCIPS